MRCKTTTKILKTTTKTLKRTTERLKTTTKRPKMTTDVMSVPRGPLSDNPSVYQPINRFFS